MSTKRSNTVLSHGFKNQNARLTTLAPLAIITSQTTLNTRSAPRKGKAQHTQVTDIALRAQQLKRAMLMMNDRAASTHPKEIQLSFYA